MLRFIINFFLFGILFYAIWFFFPEAFTKLVGWATAVFDYIKDFVNHILERINSSRTQAPAHSSAPAMLLWMLYSLRK